MCEGEARWRPIGEEHWLRCRQQQPRGLAGDHGRLNLLGPACPGPSSAPRTTGGTGPEPSAHRAAPGDAELPAPKHAAPAVPPGVPALARTGGRQGPVAEHPGLPTPRPVARHPHLPAPCWRPWALPPGPLLRAQTHRAQARREPPGERRPLGLYDAEQ